MILLGSIQIDRDDGCRNRRCSVTHWATQPNRPARNRNPGLIWLARPAMGKSWRLRTWSTISDRIKAWIQRGCRYDKRQFDRTEATTARHSRWLEQEFQTPLQLKLKPEKFITQFPADIIRSGSENFAVFRPASTGREKLVCFTRIFSKHVLPTAQALRSRNGTGS